MAKPMVLFLQSISALVEVGIGGSLVANPTRASELFPLRLHGDSMVLISFVGMFVFTLGLCGLIGSLSLWRRDCVSRIQMVWLLAAIFRCGAATLIAEQVIGGTMSLRWLGLSAVLALIAAMQSALLWLTRAGRTVALQKRIPQLKHADRMS